MTHQARRAMLKSLLAMAASSQFAHFMPARAATRQIRIGYQPSLNFLPLMVMQQEQMLERQLAKRKLAANVSWVYLGGGAAMNDALLSGQLDIGSGGIPILGVLWERTRGQMQVMGLTSLAASPYFLNVNKPTIRSLRDFTDIDRIAVPAVKTSPSAIILQMAAEKEFGRGQHGRLDHLTVTMQNPEAQVALVNRGTEVVAHMTAPPFCFDELTQPGIHRILSSTEVMGISTAIVSWATTPFIRENPDLVEAFVAAVADADALIEREPGKAAVVYKTLLRSNQALADIEAIVRHPEMSFTVEPRNSLAMIDFMHRVGSLKLKPESWKELFFPGIHTLPGS